MSVIIRLQNLPWSANALDIRQFFRGLSIPEGGVHIVGGEMGDAFIAFSTDEDARQAMMHDREAINGVQIRLLLSSRAEMQKVIETARQQSLLALKKSSGAIAIQRIDSPSAVVTINNKKLAVVPQPPVITASSFQNLLSSSAATITPSFLAYQQQAGLTLITESNSNATATKNTNDSDDTESLHSRERHRSISRERRRSRSRSKDRGIFRRRLAHSRDRSRERDRTSGRRSSRHRSRSRERSRARSRERERSRRVSDRRNSRESSTSSRNKSLNSDLKTKSIATPWSLKNSYQTSFNNPENSPNKMSSSVAKSYKSTGLTSSSSSVGGVSVTSVATTFQNYNIANQSLTALNNYSLSGIMAAGSSGDNFKGFALQNPYTTAQIDTKTSAKNDSKTTSSSAIPGIFVEKKTDETTTNEAAMEDKNSLPQEPIAFANVNPYEQMYPNLFAQAAALNSGQKSVATKPSTASMPTSSPKIDEGGLKEVDPNETNCVKLSNMCSRTTYSDLRKFFIGLFIPHNGIKLLNDKHGLRVGIAFVQFSRQSSVTKALCRSNNLLRGKSVIIEAVGEEKFLEAEDSFRPANQERSIDSDNENGENNAQDNSNNNAGFSALNPYKKIVQLEPFTVLYIEDIPALATEQDIMKMFSSYSLYDILLISSPENRREFVAHVRFSRENDAKSAYEDRAHHQIGYRRVRIRPGSLEEMENAKEKIRLANEQLLKEEQAAEQAEAEADIKRKEETKRKLEKLITDHITQDERKPQNNISMDLTSENGEDKSNQIDSTTNIDDDLDMIEDDYEEEMANNVNSQNMIFKSQNNKFNANLDPRRAQTSTNIPSLFDLDPMNNSNQSARNQNRTNFFNDPRLRNMNDIAVNAIDSNTNHSTMKTGGSNNTHLNTNLNNVKDVVSTTPLNNSTENNFVILKNCEYNTRINDVAQLLLTANLALKHIEPLHNERLLSTGEFIVEFRRSNDAEIAVKRFHNMTFRNRCLRVFPITPQEIADRLGKPFLSYIPGGNGIRMTKSMALERLSRNELTLSSSLNNNNMRYGNNSQSSLNFEKVSRKNPFSDKAPLNANGKNVKSSTNANNSSSMPEKFTYPGCVLSMENVPYKAQICDILRFFQDFDLLPDDVIRRFNDDGSPTGDARVAFNTPEEAKSAFETKKRKQMFGRNIYIKII